jgi:hypothetical protein
MRTYASRRPYLRTYARERYRRRRRVALAFLLLLDGWRYGTPPRCQVCDGADGLEIDHDDPACKSAHPSQLLTYAIDRLWRELRGCRLLCTACHMSKSAADDRKMLAETLPDPATGA